MVQLMAPECLLALGTAVAGVLVYSLAPYLPSIFPPSFTRLVGFCAVGASLAPLWAVSEGWQLPGIVGACALAVMLTVHTLQTHGQRRSYPDEDGSTTK